MSGPSWKEINPKLIEIFSALATPGERAQSPSSPAEWSDRRYKATPVTGVLSGVNLYLKITSVVGVGDDDRRLEYPGTSTPPTVFDNDIEETIYGLRRVVLNLQCTATEVSDAQWALSILERIRTRLRRRRVIDALLAIDVAIVQIMQATDISSVASQRAKSRASMDVILTMLSSDFDPVPVGWVQVLSLTSTIQNTDGTTLPTPPNVSNLIITAP